jgi:uncharacterized protein (DUF1501 family)
VTGAYTTALELSAAASRKGESAIRAFLDDLAAAKEADRVVLFAFSEFGRRPAENGSLGTDHGTAGPTFLEGRRSGPVSTARLPDLASWLTAT